MPMDSDGEEEFLKGGEDEEDDSNIFDNDESANFWPAD